MAVNWKLKRLPGFDHGWYLEVDGEPSSWSREFNRLHDYMQDKSRPHKESLLMDFDISLTRFMMLSGHKMKKNVDDYLRLDAASAILATSGYMQYLYSTDLEVA